MDTTTDTPTTDLVIIDAEVMEDDAESVANNVGHTLATAGATSALILGAVLAYKYAAPKVVAFVTRRKMETVDAVEETEVTIETPETEKV